MVYETLHSEFSFPQFFYNWDLCRTDTNGGYQNEYLKISHISYYTYTFIYIISLNIHELITNVMTKKYIAKYLHTGAYL